MRAAWVEAELTAATYRQSRRASSPLRRIWRSRSAFQWNRSQRARPAEFYIVCEAESAETRLLGEGGYRSLGRPQALLLVLTCFPHPVGTDVAHGAGAADQAAQANQMTPMMISGIGFPAIHVADARIATYAS